MNRFEDECVRQKKILEKRVHAAIFELVAS